MDAVVCTDFGESEVRDVPTPEPADDEVLIAVERVQLSVTECSLYRGANVIHAESIRERIESGDGRLFGHEFCGEIVETGPAVTRFEAGDRVYAPGRIPCHDCAYCRAGYHHFCKDKVSIGYDTPGALAEYLTLPEWPLSTLPEGVSPAAGAAMQPLHNSLIAVRDAGLDSGDVVAVLGTGVMGYQCGQFALNHGAGQVVAVDVVTEKLELAAERGMDPVDATETDPVEAVLDATDGIGADVVFECVGGAHDHGTESDDPLARAFAMARSGGKVVQIGHIAGEVPITPRAVRSRAVDWVNPTTAMHPIGPNANSGEVAAELVADGRVSIEEYVTHVFDDLGEFDRLVDVTLEKGEHGALGPAQIAVSA